MTEVSLTTVGSALLCEAKHDVLTFLCREEREESYPKSLPPAFAFVLGFWILRRHGTGGGCTRRP
jgi:hypothetical protein